MVARQRLYLAAGAEVFALGGDALVVINIVLPAVLGPAIEHCQTCRRLGGGKGSVLVHLGETSIVTCDPVGKCQSYDLQIEWDALSPR